MPNFEWKKHPEMPVPAGITVLTKRVCKYKMHNHIRFEEFRRPFNQQPKKFSPDYYEQKDWSSPGIEWMPLDDDIDLYWLEKEALE